jgi:hypothetical protein
MAAEHTPTGLDDDAPEIQHWEHCDTAAHTDPAFDCATQPVELHGQITHIALTRDANDAVRGEAFMEPTGMGPFTLTSGACFALAARYTTLGQILAGIH